MKSTLIKSLIAGIAIFTSTFAAAESCIYNSAAKWRMCLSDYAAVLRLTNEGSVNSYGGVSYKLWQCPKGKKTGCTAYFTSKTFTLGPKGYAQSTFHALPDGYSWYASAYQNGTLIFWTRDKLMNT